MIGIASYWRIQRNVAVPTKVWKLTWESYEHVGEEHLGEDYMSRDTLEAWVKENFNTELDAYKLYHRALPSQIYNGKERERVACYMDACWQEISTADDNDANQIEDLSEASLGEPCDLVETAVEIAALKEEITSIEGPLKEKKARLRMLGKELQKALTL